MTYLIYQDSNGWRIARSDGQLDKLTRSYSKLDVHITMRGMSLLGIKYEVHKMLERVKQEVRYTN